MGRKWTKEEDDYLLTMVGKKMNNGKLFSGNLVYTLFVQHFERLYPHRIPRTVKAVKQHRVDMQGMDYKKKKASDIDYILPTPGPELATRARQRWTSADDEHLVSQWKLGTIKRRECAISLGRTVKACEGRFYDLRKRNAIPKEEIPTPLKPVVEITKEEELILESEGTSTTVTTRIPHEKPFEEAYEEHTKVVVDNTPVVVIDDVLTCCPCCTGEQTWLDKMYIKLKTRRATKDKNKRDKLQKKLDKLTNYNRDLRQ